MFYGKTADEMVRQVVYQTRFYPDLANESFQNHAYAAIDRFGTEN